MRQEVRGIRQWMRECLEGWINLEEDVAILLQSYPDLDDEQQEEVGESFWLDGEVVRTFRQGQGYYQLRMFQEARPYFDEVVQSEPDFLLGRIYLALSQFQSAQWSEAQRHFQLVAETADHLHFQVFAFHMLGCVHVKRGQDERAIHYFKRALEIDTEHGDSWFNLGACYTRLQDYHEAIPCFYHALRTGEGDWEAMYYLALCYEQAGRSESAAYWRMAAFEEIKQPEMMEEIARDFETSGDVDGAIRWYRKLLQRCPKRVTGYHGISWLLWQQGAHEEARALLKKALSLAPQDSELLFTFAWFQLQEGEMEGIQQILRQLSRSITEEPMWLILRARLHARAHEWEQAIDLADQVIRQTQGDRFIQSLGHYQMGRVLLQQQKPREARAHFRDAATITPNWREPLFFEGLCHWMEGNPEGMRRCWEAMPLEGASHDL